MSRLFRPTTLSVRSAQPSIVVFLCICFVASSCSSRRGGPGLQECVPPANVSLNVPLYPQELTNWCWAASGQMVLKQLGIETTQCAEAQDEFSGLTCCPSDSASDGCDEGGWPQFDKFNLIYRRTNSKALSLSELKKQLGCAKQPVAFSWRWIDNSGGHMMVAIGYSNVNGEDLVEVNDPWEPKIGSHRFMSYAAFNEAADHKHWDDFYAFSR